MSTQGQGKKFSYKANRPLRATLALLLLAGFCVSIIYIVNVRPIGLAILLGAISFYFFSWLGLKI